MATTEAEGVFAKLANQVLEAAEQIVARVDEGVSVLMHGELPTAARGNIMDPGASDFDIDYIDEDMAGSPLEGIAESVLGDIMGGQVRENLILVSCCDKETTVVSTPYSLFTHNSSISSTGWSTNTNGSLPCLSCCS